MDSPRLSPQRQAGLEHMLRRFDTEYLALNSISENRRREQLRLLRKFAATLDHPILELTSSDLRSFLGGMLRDGLNPTTATKYLGMIRPFITWAYEANLIDGHRKNQLSLVANPRGGAWKNRPNPYTAEEIAAFYELLRTRFPMVPAYGKGSQMLAYFQRGASRRIHTLLWRHAWRLQYEATVSLALEAGLRRIEIYGLSIPALHPDNTEVIVATAKQGPGGREVLRAIPYTDHARYRVGQWLDFRHKLGVEHESPWLSLEGWGGDREAQLSPIAFRRFGRCLERGLGTQKWRWHRFRHTAATEWLRAGVPLEKVRRFMGHSTVELTLAYAELLDGDVRDAFGVAESAFAQRLGLVIPGEAA